MTAVRAPEIDRSGLRWFNVDTPLSLDTLHGRLVILDFWTFCCINCMHIVPTLRRIEEMFPEEVVVIGVHSPKFAAEKDPANLEQAIARYGIVHPVVHDPDFHIWREYAVRAWPTLVFIGPTGYVIGQHSGEPDPERLTAVVRQVLDDYRRDGKLAPRPLDLKPVAAPGNRFRFPSKLKSLGQGTSRWVLADAGNNQIVLLDDLGTEIRRFGDGRPGFDDGTADHARFDAPQGLIADAGAVYVADTGNHALRRIDLETGGVSTLAGTGRRGGILGSAWADGVTVALASPWDCEILGNRLFFANAGTHQLGEYDLSTGQVRRLAGSGAEALGDGPAADAQLAQPSGLALTPDGRALYFADSETSSVRVLDLSDKPAVRTLVGTGLFDFGHDNGPFARARLQHPLGVAVGGEDKVLVADSYNAEIRVLDLNHRSVGDYDGGRFTCTDAVCLPLAEPAGVAQADPDRVLLVDTNNHRILEFRNGDRTYHTWAE